MSFLLEVVAVGDEVELLDNELNMLEAWSLDMAIPFFYWFDHKSGFSQFQKQKPFWNCVPSKGYANASYVRLSEDRAMVKVIPGVIRQCRFSTHVFENIVGSFYKHGFPIVNHIRVQDIIIC